MNKLSQTPQLERRVVHTISRYLEPREIFRLLSDKAWPYSIAYQKEYACRDRAMMALAYCSAGRITEVVGGHRFEKEQGKLVIVGKHPGLLPENIEVTDKIILINNMTVVKRSRRLIAKYGQQIAHRDSFAIPLQCGLYRNQFWDQLVPFGWLLREYLSKYAPKQGKIFRFERCRAWQIIFEVTGMFPNWFRAQAEHFYGHFLLSDTVKLAKFVNVQDPKHVKHYIGYSWTEQLKDREVSMDFSWIEPQIAEIRERIESS